MNNKELTLGSLFSGSGGQVFQREWKPVKDYEDRYFVNENGDVYSTISSRCLSHIVDREGYHLVGLNKDGEHKKCRVHRLVAEAFIPNPERLPTVNHIDEDKGNNHVSNLEWASYGLQVHHGTRSERAMKSITSRRLRQMDQNGRLIGVYESVREAVRKTGIYPEGIIAAATGKQDLRGGFRWGYESKSGSSGGHIHSVGVLQCDRDGNVLARYRSVNDAAKALGVSPSGISLCLSGKRKTNKGFIWKRDMNPLPEYEPIKTPVLQFDKQGSFIMRFDSINEAARAAGVGSGTLCRCLDGRRKSCGGYQWKYA